MRYSIDMVYAHIQRKKNLIPDFKSEVIDNVEKNITYVVGIGIIAGIVSSSLGIGGGMITNPAFSSLGMDPKQSSSTSNFLIIITAIASSFIFILSGQLIIGYSICLGIFCSSGINRKLLYFKIYKSNRKKFHTSSYNAIFFDCFIIYYII